MSKRKMQNIRHFFGGGFATDFGPTADVQIRGDGSVVIPFLVDAENCIYELDGGPRKIGGTTKGNSSAVASGATITGLYDYWRQGTGGSPQRRRILHAGTVAMTDNDDFSFSNILTGLTSNAVPSYSTFDDFLIIGSDASADVPKSYDGTTAQNLAGSPPRFSFSTPHYGRQFAAGVYANPSTLYYSVAFDPEDWTGSGSGSIRIDPNDGDMITGIASYKGELWVFKGPYKGSIHRITGTSNSDFAVKPFIKAGLGAAWHNSIFQFGDDLGFVSQYGTVHSLKATDAFGDFLESAISRPIHRWIREHLNFTRLRNIWAVNNPQEGYVMLTISIDSSTTNNACIAFDYRRYPNEPVRWMYWPAYRGGSTNLFYDTNGIKRVLLGGNDGFVYKTQMAARSINEVTAIGYKITTPYFNYGDPMKMKTLYKSSVGISPKGNYNGTFLWQRDDNAQQSITFDQGGGDLLGPSSVDPFTLDTSMLGGSQYIDRYMELTEGGEFRAIQYQVTQSGVGEDIELHSITASITPSSDSTEN